MSVCVLPEERSSTTLCVWSTPARCVLAVAVPDDARPFPREAVFTEPPASFDQIDGLSSSQARR